MAWVESTGTPACVAVHKCSGWDETEAVLIKLESPECNVVDRVGSMVGERCKNRDSGSCVGLLGLCSRCLRYGVTLK